MAKDRVRNAGKILESWHFWQKMEKKRTKFYPKGFFPASGPKHLNSKYFSKLKKQKLSAFVHCHLNLCLYPAYLAIQRFFITCMQMLQSKMQQIEIQSLTCLVFIFNLTTFLSNIRNTVSMQSFLSFSFWLSY